MRLLDISSLHDGMITGMAITVAHNVIIPKDTVLKRQDISQISSLLNSDTKVWIYDLAELKPAILRNNNLARQYINFLIITFNQLFAADLTNKEAIDVITKMLEFQLYANRNLLYESILLRDNHCYTYEHSLNVALYSLVIGLNEELTTEELKTLILGCMLHDLGKRAISSTILDKPAKLSFEEFNAIKQHPLYGVELVKGLESIDDRVKKIILQHHEKLDGTGYPFGLNCDRINHLSKIAAVADIFDAVTSKRAYHSQRSSISGIKILKSDMNNGKIASDEVNNLVKSITLYPVNTIVLLNNEVSGVVLEDCNSLKPVVLGYDNNIYDLSRRKELSVVEVL